MPTPGFQITCVRLRVSDVERSCAYYAALIGLRPSQLGSDQATLVDPGSGTVILELVRAETPGRAPVQVAGLFHTAFLYPGREGLGAAITRIAEGGFAYTGAADHGVSEAIYLDDPDGLGIELYRDRPPERWPRNDDGSIGMFTRPLDTGAIAADAAPGTAEETATGVGIGHVHLRVADLGAAEEFWCGQIGLELMAEMPGALFMAAEGYHHHIGANTWQSAGAVPAPSDRPGLDEIVIAGTGVKGESVTTPERVDVKIKPLEE